MKPLFRIGIAALVAMQLGGAFAPLDFRAPMAAAAALILVTGFPLMTGTFRKAAAIFIALGAAMLLYSKQPPMAWIEASVSMTNIIGIVAVMQVFSVPIKLGDYDSAIRSWLDRRFTTERSLFAFTTLAAHVLTSFLNLGSIPVMVSLFEDTLMRRVSEYERFFASATTRGYVLAALWSPGAVNLFLVVQATDLSWSEVFLPGFVLAAGGMVLSYAMETKKSGVLAPAARREPLEQTAPPSHPEGPSPSDPSARSRVSHIIAVASVFVLVMALMEALRIGQKSSRMILAGALVALAWLFALRRRPGLATALKQYWSQGILKAADVAPFFVAMGIFSGALESSGAMDIVGPVLQSASSALGGAAVIMIGLLIILCALVGIHPFITIVLFGKVLAHAELPIPPLTIALSLAVGGAASYMITPFAGVIMTISKLIGAKATDVAVRWNWRFSLAFFAVGMLFAFAWGAIFG